ncbi:hypothetical protein WJX73_006716 [Symbiochloris irregularis]|uniref:Uncharacterized protein n=1 Tax=Symbiochloris irregularis TaxID=706552 RepID=A0AAW1P1L0_9CHLO
MGQVFSSFWLYWFPNKEYKLVMVGLDNAGKTTALFKLHLGEAITTQPTIGSNVEQVEFKNLTFEVWDLGGQASLRPSWASYYKATDAIILVLDSTDRARVRIAKGELQSILGHEDLRTIGILILANKQDLKDAMSVEEMSTALALTDIRDHPWHIQPCCALSGEGLFDGMEWIAQRVNQLRT